MKHFHIHSLIFTIENLEKTFLVLFLILLPFQLRHTFFSLSIYRGNYSDFWALSIYASDLAFACLMIVSYKTMRNSKTATGSILLIIALLIALLYIGHYPTIISNSDSKEKVMRFIFTITKWLELFLVFRYFSFTLNKYKYLILQTITISGTIQAIIGILQFIFQKSIGLHVVGEPIIGNYIGIAKIIVDNHAFIRPYGLTTHPNQLSAILIVSYGTLLAMWEQFVKRYIYWGYTCLFILIFSILLTFSRAALLTFIVFNLIVLITFKIKAYFSQKNSFADLFHVVSIFFVVSCVILSPFLLSRATITDSATISRLNYDFIGIKQFITHPIIGVGPGQSIFNVQSYFTKENMGFTQNTDVPVWNIQPAHNFFILVACETGLIGLILIIWLFIYLLIKLYNQIKVSIGENGYISVIFFALFIAILILMQFDHYFYTLQQTQLLLWVVIGCIWNIIKEPATGL